MAIAKGVFMQVRYKKNAGAFGALPGASGAQLLRRVTSNIAVTRDTYESNEIRDDQQRSDYRLGVQRVAGPISGELSPKTYADFLGTLLRRIFTAGVSLTGLSITIATGSVVGGIQTYTLTRASGDFLTGGVKIGDIVRLTAGTFNVANSNKNLLVIALTATVATVITLNRSVLVAEGPIASATLAVSGKKTWVPTTGHTDEDYGIEHWYADLGKSELFLGCKPASAAINLPASGLATIEIPIMGQAMTPADAAYFTSPTAATGTVVAAAANGFLIVNGAPIGVVTGLQINVNGNLTAEAVVGSNVVPEIMVGRLVASGQLTAYFDSVTLRDLFLNESEVSLVGVFTSDNSAAADFVTFVMPRIKATSNGRQDAQQGITQTASFEALLNVNGGTGISSEKTTISIQDSAA